MNDPHWDDRWLIARTLGDALNAGGSTDDVAKAIERMIDAKLAGYKRIPPYQPVVDDPTASASEGRT